MKPVAILGCGPAGLMAAQACALAERPFAIFSRPDKSKLGGAQFLHRPIPGINESDPDTVITYRKSGDGATYREKVYGDEMVPFTSFDGVEDGQTQHAWNLGSTYDRLWEQYGDKINPTMIDPNFVDSIVDGDDFDHIFSTVPLPVICRARAGLSQGFHSFRVQDIVISTERFVHDVEPDTIVYDGTNEHSWYRASMLFGFHGCEWANVGPPLPGLIRDRKPIGTTCDCYQGKVLRLGRRGTWLKGVLTHDAFINAIEVFM